MIHATHATHAARAAPAVHRPRQPAGSRPLGAAAVVVAMQRRIGNHVTARSIQRIVQDAAGKAIEPGRSTKKWAALDAAQRARARRMVNDPYQLFEFADAGDFFDVLTGVKPDPGPKKSYYRKSGSKSSSGAPLGEKDPLFEHHAHDASGGLLTERKQTPFGAPALDFGTTVPHVSNWASFVEVHYDGALKRLDKAGLNVGATATELKRLHARAIKHADVMDRQEAEKHDELTLSTGGDVWSGLAVEQSVNAMWDLVAKETGKSRAHYAKAALPRWGQLNRGGMGTRVSATFVNDPKHSVVAGSAASKTLFKPPWLAKLDRRIDGVTMKSAYILGHLLNDNLGGPSAPYNIVPLTNDANAHHLHVVENIVKKKVLEMYAEMRTEHSPRRDPLTEVRYSVEAMYGGHPQRTYTSNWIEAYNFLLHIIKQLEGKKGFTKAMSVGNFHNILMLGKLAHRNVDGVVMDLQNAWTDRLKAFMDVVAYDRTTTVATAFSRIDLLSDVWRQEEKYVPTKLVCNISAWRGVDEDDDARVVNGEIPNNIAAYRMIEPGRG